MSSTLLTGKNTNISYTDLMIKILSRNNGHRCTGVCAYMDAMLLEQMRFSKRDCGNAYSAKIVVRVYKNHSAVEGLVPQQPSCYERFCVVN